VIVVAGEALIDLQIVVIHTEPGGPHLFKIIQPCRRHQRPRAAVHLGQPRARRVGVGQGAPGPIVGRDQDPQASRAPMS
jgi:hypothetical protein